MNARDNLGRGSRTLRLPFQQEEYPRFMNDNEFTRKQIDTFFQKYPELFPTGFDKGYVLNGRTPPSAKLEYQLRRITLKADGTTFTIAPAFLMPYMTALTEDVEKALFLRRFNVPYWGLTYAFGRDDMFWYRQEQALGRFSIVGTTVKSPEALPQDLLADEKHTWRGGDKQYIAMTVAKECILGAELTESASEDSLTEAYGVFAGEARSVSPDYAPDTVNTDGWAATQKTWKNLFPGITVILCFFHAFIKIRSRATKALTESFHKASEKVWDAYNAVSRASFAQRLRRLKEWTAEHVPDSPMKDNILDLCAKRSMFSKSYDHKNAHRTSNMVDRLMKFIDRACFDGMYFHGTRESGNQRVRALALLWNFCPSSPATVKKHGGQMCPAERLNGKRYHDVWLANLLVSASMNGNYAYQQNPL